MLLSLISNEIAVHLLAYKPIDNDLAGVGCSKKRVLP